MKIELDEDRAELALRAVEHYFAYLVSQKREDVRYVALGELLMSARIETRKPPKAQAGQPARAKKKA